MKCGLLGRQLGHSYSPQIHAMLGSYSYTLFEKEPEEIGHFLKNGDFTGINVTVPYKKDVIPYLDEMTPIAQRLGAVNTIVRRNGKLIGHNTDYFGFQQMLRASGLDVKGKKVLVLGSGGASATVVAVLQQHSNVVTISRTGDNNYQNLHRHADAAVVINTTPVGMYPNVGHSPIDLELFPALEGVLDVVYNPARTKLLLDAEKRGLVAMNGLLMLAAQAKESAQWFTSTQIDDGVTFDIYKKLQYQMENIVLIGMPGCGKTTVGKLLSERLRKPFANADAEVVKYAGRSIPDIFAIDGESAFRVLETQALTKLGPQSGLVLATGGGCVTRQENYDLLHQNGTIFCLKRDLHKLPTENRPLSQAGNLEDMYRIRKPLYEAFADYMVDNNGDLSQTVDEIVRILEDKL